jgi:hypothetical protein
MSDARTLSNKFLGDLQRQYDKKGYEVIEWVYENHPLKYFLLRSGEPSLAVKCQGCLPLGVSCHS